MITPDWNIQTTLCFAAEATLSQSSGTHHTQDSTANPSDEGPTNVETEIVGNVTLGGGGKVGEDMPGGGGGEELGGGGGHAV